MEPKSTTNPISSTPSSNDRLAASNWREVSRVKEDSKEPEPILRPVEDTNSRRRNSSSDLPPTSTDPVASSSTTSNASDLLPVETTDPYEAIGSGWAIEEDASTPESEASKEEEEEEEETGIGWGDETNSFEQQEEEDEERTPTPVPNPNRSRSEEPSWIWKETGSSNHQQKQDDAGFETELTWDDEPSSTNGPRTTSFDWASEPILPRRPNHLEEEPVNDFSSPSPPSRYTPSATGAESTSSSSFLQPTTPSPPRSSTIFVNNLSFQTREQGLAATLSFCGKVVRSRIPSDPLTGASKGFAYVEFEREEQAERALREMNGVEVDGRRIRLEFSQSRSRREEAGVGGGGGFEGTQQPSSDASSFGGGRGPWDQPYQSSRDSSYVAADSSSFEGRRPFETPPRGQNAYAPPRFAHPHPSLPPNFNQRTPPTAPSSALGSWMATYPNSVPLGRGSGTGRFTIPQRSQPPAFSTPPPRPQSLSFTTPPSRPLPRFSPSTFTISPSQPNGRDSAPPGAGAARGARKLPTSKERAQRKVPFAERNWGPKTEASSGWGEEERGDFEEKDEGEDAGGWDVGRSEKRSEMLR